MDETVQIGCNLDSVVEATCEILQAARKVGIPLFFTTAAWDPADPPSPQNMKLKWNVPPGQEGILFQLHSRLEHRPTEKIIRKKYASAFKAANLHEMLASLSVDELIVTGVSTSHCVYATCRDATDSFRVIVAQEAVGERCEIMHEINLLDIDLGDVMPTRDVIAYLDQRTHASVGHSERTSSDASGSPSVT